MTFFYLFFILLMNALFLTNKKYPFIPHENFQRFSKNYDIRGAGNTQRGRRRAYFQGVRVSPGNLFFKSKNVNNHGVGEQLKASERKYNKNLSFKLIKNKQNTLQINKIATISKKLSSIKGRLEIQVAMTFSSQNCKSQIFEGGGVKSKFR